MDLEMKKQLGTPPGPRERGQERSQHWLGWGEGVQHLVVFN